MGELQHGVYDDCEGLTYEEINVLYGLMRREDWLKKKTMINLMI